MHALTEIWPDCPGNIKQAWNETNDPIRKLSGQGLMGPKDHSAYEELRITGLG